MYFQVLPSVMRESRKISKVSEDRIGAVIRKCLELADLNG